MRLPMLQTAPVSGAFVRTLGTSVTQPSMLLAKSAHCVYRQPAASISTAATTNNMRVVFIVPLPLVGNKVRVPALRASRCRLLLFGGLLFCALDCLAARDELPRERLAGFANF